MSGEIEDRNLEVACVAWHEIKPHLERDAVITVSSKYGLIDVAKAIAADETEAVEKWILEGSLAKPTTEQLTSWNKDPMVEFECAIVQPFVLIQLPDG